MKFDASQRGEKKRLIAIKKKARTEVGKGEKPA